MAVIVDEMEIDFGLWHVISKSIKFISVIKSNVQLRTYLLPLLEFCTEKVPPSPCVRIGRSSCVEKYTYYVYTYVCICKYLRIMYIQQYFKYVYVHTH